MEPDEGTGEPGEVLGEQVRVLREPGEGMGEQGEVLGQPGEGAGGGR